MSYKDYVPSSRIKVDQDVEEAITWFQEHRQQLPKVKFKCRKFITILDPEKHYLWVEGQIERLDDLGYFLRLALTAIIGDLQNFHERLARLKKKREET